MAKVKVGVAGYGVIGQRLADGVALQGDMELVGVADVAVTLSVRALREKGMPYKFFLAAPDKREEFDKAGIPVSGTLEDLVQQVDVMLDATSAGVGAKNRLLYEKYGKKAIFQGGEKNSVADVFSHGYANYEKGIGTQFLKLTSCNTTSLIRAVDCIDRKVGVEKVAITIIRRVADSGECHRILPRASAHPRRVDCRRIFGQRESLPVCARPWESPRRHVRNRGLGRHSGHERQRCDVRDQCAAGSGGCPRKHGCSPRVHAHAARPHRGDRYDEPVPGYRQVAQCRANTGHLRIHSESAHLRALSAAPLLTAFTPFIYPSASFSCANDLMSLNAFGVTKSRMLRRNNRPIMPLTRKPASDPSVSDIWPV